MRDRLTITHGSTSNIVVVLVTFSTKSLDDDHDPNGPPFIILRDLERATYRAYGLRSGSFRDVWNWQTLKQYATILRRDGFGALTSPTDDTRQLGGDFVIASDGRLAWGYWSDGPADRPSADEVVSAVEAAQR